ncbi:hypothetical protein GPJ56_010159 [Histomonas meleagridis]|uniref:uncharacterized protein n=1 Tax=Histomonas meleagridis TaxID=135588 RepID=UPI00355A29BA|nr:hypothetical protein GPJ56_010159 [Histomonas meleagridis]KAH0804695.1 hypothetical protein GO595_002389 [Histomonas meleagridis]
MEQDINWDNLEANSIQALKFACQQNRLHPHGKTKRDYINALKKIRPNKSNYSTINNFQSGSQGNRGNSQTYISSRLGGSQPFEPQYNQQRFEQPQPFEPQYNQQRFVEPHPFESQFNQQRFQNEMPQQRGFSPSTANGSAYQRPITNRYQSHQLTSDGLPIDPFPSYSSRSSSYSTRTPTPLSSRSSPVTTQRKISSMIISIILFILIIIVLSQIV